MAWKERGPPKGLKALSVNNVGADIGENDFKPDLLEGRVRTTCSFGVAESGERMINPEGFHSAADRALFDAKTLGRNRVNREPLPHDPTDR